MCSFLSGESSYIGKNLNGREYGCTCGGFVGTDITADECFDFRIENIAGDLASKVSNSRRGIPLTDTAVSFSVKCRTAGRSKIFSCSVKQTLGHMDRRSGSMAKRVMRDLLFINISGPSGTAS